MERTFAEKDCPYCSLRMSVEAEQIIPTNHGDKIIVVFHYGFPIRRHLTKKQFKIPLFLISKESHFWQDLLQIWLTKIPDVLDDDIVDILMKSCHKDTLASIFADIVIQLYTTRKDNNRNTEEEHHDT